MKKDFYATISDIINRKWRRLTNRRNLQSINEKNIFKKMKNY